MSDKLLTISIAAYNAASYLSDALDSVLTIPDSGKLEVIVVNDGSQDSTLDIANAYAVEYPDIVRVIDKPNGNYGSTINASIPVATGKYYRLLDADDWMDSKEFQQFVSDLYDCDADLVVSPFTFVFDDGRRAEIYDGTSKMETGLYNFDDLVLNTRIPMHSFTIKTEILQANGIKITEGCPYTDLEFVLKPIPFISTVYNCAPNVYRYRLGREGQSVSVESWQRNLDKAITVTCEIAAFYESISSDPGVSDFKKNYILRSAAGSAANKYRILLSLPVTEDNKRRLRDFDSKLDALSSTVHAVAGESGGKLVKALFASNRKAYLFLSIFYRIKLKLTSGTSDC